MPLRANLIAQGRPYLLRADFAEREVEYKVRLGLALARAKNAVPDGSRPVLARLNAALTSRDNNIVNWRTVQRFMDGLARNPRVGVRHLNALWRSFSSVERRFARFTEFLAEIGLPQPGQQLALTSTLLMANGAHLHPPVRTRLFKWAGAFNASRRDTPAARYSQAIAALREIQRRGRRAKLVIPSPLVAQGLLWAVYSEWDLGKRSQSSLERTPEEDVAAARADLARLTTTERRAVIAARRGQGRFREALLQYWAGCAVTELSTPALLRASHLKPWRDSTNRERLDLYNGVLLAPSLDAALDRYLISFDTAGRLRSSKALSPADKRSLGLVGGMRLRRVEPGHRRYLADHYRRFLKAETVR